MEKTFLHFLVPADLLKRIEAFRFESRSPSRAAAVIFLIEKGLKAVGGKMKM
jgi:hypothetical protein